MKRLLYLLAVLPLFLLVGCSNEDFEQEGGTKPPTTNGDIEFNIGFAPQNDGKTGTRVATDAQFKSTWENGDEIGIFAVKRVASNTTSTLATSDNYIHNVKLTYNKTDNKWTTDAGVVLYYPNDGEVLDFYAYYPYDDNGGTPATLDPTAITFNVLTDQSVAANYNLSDLLSATPVKGIAKGTAVDLTFAHMLALVQVEIDPTYIDRKNDFTATLRECKVGGVFNLGDGTLSTTGDAVAVKMLRVETDPTTATTYTYRALVPAQTVAQGSSLCLMAQNGQLYNTPKLDGDLSLTASAAKRYTATLPASAIQTVKILNGTFLMGSSDGSGNNGMNPTPADPNRETNETQHKVTLSKDFYMSKYTITFAQYDAFCDAENKTKPSDETWGRDDRPVINVTWHDAVAYCAWLSEQTGGRWRLPTEAEWEYACRGAYENKATEANTKPFGLGDGSKLFADMANFDGRYPYALPSGHIDNFAGDANHPNTYLGKTQPVGSYTANSYGLYDMHGNVFEWCSDWYDSYGSSAATDPVGSAAGYYRVLRGGGWFPYAQYCRSAYRSHDIPDDRSDLVGFRVVFVP